MTEGAGALGLRTDHEAGNVGQKDDWQVEVVAELDEVPLLVGRRSRHRTADQAWVVGDDSDGVAADPGQDRVNRGAEVGLDFEELALVD